MLPSTTVCEHKDDISEPSTYKSLDGSYVLSASGPAKPQFQFSPVFTTSQRGIDIPFVHIPESSRGTLCPSTPRSLYRSHRISENEARGCREQSRVVCYHDEGSTSSFIFALPPFLANHFRLPIRVSRCGAAVESCCPPAVTVVLILLRYVSTRHGYVESVLTPWRNTQARCSTGKTYVLVAKTWSSPQRPYPVSSSSDNPNHSPSPLASSSRARFSGPQLPLLPLLAWAQAQSSSP